jgi:hypothetical protein
LSTKTAGSSLDAKFIMNPKKVSPDVISMLDSPPPLAVQAVCPGAKCSAKELLWTALPYA